MNLVGPGGLLGGLTKQVLETALEAEMSEHLGYDANDPIGRNGENSSKGVRTKTVITDVGSIFGLWVGTGGEGAKYWLQVLIEIKNRGVEDVCMWSVTASKDYRNRSPRHSRHHSIKRAFCT